MTRQQHYESLEVDEFWTYVGNKKNKIWLIYAYHRATGEKALKVIIVGCDTVSDGHLEKPAVFQRNSLTI